MVAACPQSSFFLLFSSPYFATSICASWGSMSWFNSTFTVTQGVKITFLRTFMFLWFVWAWFWSTGMVCSDNLGPPQNSQPWLAWVKHEQNWFSLHKCHIRSGNHISGPFYKFLNRLDSYFGCSYWFVRCFKVPCLCAMCCRAGRSVGWITLTSSILKVH